MPPTLMPALSPNFLGGWCVWQVVWPLSLRTFKVDWYPTRGRQHRWSKILHIFRRWSFRYLVSKQDLPIHDSNKRFPKKKKESDCRTFRLSDRKDSRGIFLEYLSPFVSPLLSRITARAKTSAKVTPVQSILRHIEPHLFARSNLENIHASFIPTVRSSFPILRPSFSSHVSLFCHSSVTAKSSVNKKGDTYVRNLLSDGADKKHLAHSFRSYRKHDWDCYPSSDS